MNVPKATAAIAAAALIAIGTFHNPARADEQLDDMVRQMQSKKQAPLTGSRTCGNVEIRWQTVVNENPPGPSVDFSVYNHSPHTVAVKFGFKLVSESAEEYTRSAFPGIGTGHLNAGTADRSLTSGSGIFAQSIADGGDHPQIFKVEITPVYVAPNIDVPPPNNPPGSYIDTWRDYPDMIVCH